MSTLSSFFTKKPTHCQTFEDLKNKVRLNDNLTDDDINSCNVTGPDMANTFKHKTTNININLLTLAIINLNVNNVKKLLNVICVDDKTDLSPQRALFYMSDAKAQDSEKVFKITQMLLQKGADLTLLAIAEQDLHQNPAFTSAVELIKKTQQEATHPAMKK